jgi:hypothetical protein
LELRSFVVSKRIAFLLFVLSLNVYSCAQKGAVEHGWTDKNDTQMYSAYLLQHAYNEQGYWGAKAEIRQAETKRVFVVEPERIYHVERFDIFALSDRPEEAMTNSPKAGDVYSPRSPSDRALRFYRQLQSLGELTQPSGFGILLDVGY